MLENATSVEFVAPTDDVKFVVMTAQMSVSTCLARAAPMSCPMRTAGGVVSAQEPAPSSVRSTRQTRLATVRVTSVGCTVAVVVWSVASAVFEIAMAA